MVLITEYFSNFGVPSTGLTPSIRVRNAASGVLAITDAAMAEIGDGWYRYNFVAYDKDLDYTFRCDGGVALPDAERYTYGTNANYIEDIDGKLGDVHGSGTWDNAGVDTKIDQIIERTDRLPDDPAADITVTTSEDDIRGADDDDLKDLSDDLDEIKGTLGVGPGTGTHTINGQVVDAVTLLPVANVTVRGLDNTTRLPLVADITDNGGNWTLYLDAATYIFEFTGDDYTEREISATVPSGAPFIIDFDDIS